MLLLPLTLIFKPISTLIGSRDRRIVVKLVALHWAYNPLQTVSFAMECKKIVFGIL